MENHKSKPAIRGKLTLRVGLDGTPTETNHLGISFFSGAFSVSA